MAELKKELMAGLFGNASQIETNKIEVKDDEEDVVVEIDKMLDFHSDTGCPVSHPFRRLSSPKYDELKESIKKNGLLYPIIMRPDIREGYYEVIGGHNRRDIMRDLGFTRLSKNKGEIQIVDVDDDTAIEQMMDTNLQRDELKIMERAWAYRIKLELNKRKPGRHALSQFETESKRSDQLVADELGDSRGKSRANIQRYARLTYLIKDLQDLVDAKKIQVNVGYELSFLSEDQQEIILLCCQQNYKINLEQSRQIREMGKAGLMSEDEVKNILLPKPKAPMQQAFKATEKHFRKIDKEKLERIDPDVLERLVTQAIDAYLAQL